MKYDYYSKNGLPTEMAWKNLEDYLRENDFQVTDTPPPYPCTPEALNEIREVFKGYGLSIEERDNNKEQFFQFLKKPYFHYSKWPARHSYMKLAAEKVIGP